MRFLLIIVVIAAVAALLWGTWQIGRRVFYATLVAVLAALAIWVSASLVTNNERRQPAATDSVTVTLQAVHETETSYRIKADISNHGKRPVAKVWLQAEALHCTSSSACDVLYQQQRPVPIHVPVDGSYPLALMIDKPSPAVKVDRWRLKVLKVQVYGH